MRQYKAEWELCAPLSLVFKDYSPKRCAMAKEITLGKKGKGKK